ncbi:MAG: pyridoxamine 5'-phosphate oxidase family protein [Defluviitaleaceae bacterium]|nr:pyridoxamine 5'-phosphate oxidase family protein [Defluviitaleaceae bacterium]
MSQYEEGIVILKEKFGNDKDNVIALATIEQTDNNKPRPIVRDVDAYYEDGVFYVVTWAKSTKMQHIAQNNEVGIAVCFEWFNANGIGENLGWVLDPKNAELRTKLRKAFAKWYDMANNENDENCCILAIRLTKGIININHHEKLYYMDFVNKTATVRE